MSLSSLVHDGMTALGQMTAMGQSNSFAIAAATTVFPVPTLDVSMVFMPLDNLDTKKDQASSCLENNLFIFKQLIATVQVLVKDYFPLMYLAIKKASIIPSCALVALLLFCQHSSGARHSAFQAAASLVMPFGT